MLQFTSRGYCRARVGNLKQRVPITSKSSKFKGETQRYVVKLPKSAGARHYCTKIPRVPGTLSTRANSVSVLTQALKRYINTIFSAYNLKYMFTTSTF